ncbi:MAG: TOPRIM nucleotidyl transferase/hydrolase domain-containing protein [Nitrososphaeraceae archaeon]
MINGISKTYPESGSGLRSIELKSHNFKPEIFFSNCNIFVEGPSDKAALAAISDSLNDIFAKYSIQIIDVDGRDTLEKYVPLLKDYSPS